MRWNRGDERTIYFDNLVYSVLYVAGERCRYSVGDGDVEGLGCILANDEKNSGIESAYLDGVVFVYAGVLDL